MTNGSSDLGLHLSFPEQNDLSTIINSSTSTAVFAAAAAACAMAAAVTAGTNLQGNNLTTTNNHFNKHNETSISGGNNCLVPRPYSSAFITRPSVTDTRLLSSVFDPHNTVYTHLNNHETSLLHPSRHFYEPNPYLSFTLNKLTRSSPNNDMNSRKTSHELGIMTSTSMMTKEKVDGKNLFRDEFNIFRQSSVATPEISPLLINKSAYLHHGEETDQFQQQFHHQHPHHQHSSPEPNTGLMNESWQSVSDIRRHTAKQVLSANEIPSDRFKKYSTSAGFDCR
ncbi:unnamed protein product [Heterobilharzia americana]|nr:unnamed protein product [Heterobilharzia americana]